MVKTYNYPLNTALDQFSIYPILKYPVAISLLGLGEFFFLNQLLDFSLTNQFLIVGLTLGFFYVLNFWNLHSFSGFSQNQYDQKNQPSIETFFLDDIGEISFYPTNNRWNFFQEKIHFFISETVNTNINSESTSADTEETHHSSQYKNIGYLYFPFIYTVFLFVGLSNSIGLIPYSFTTTSHIIVTLSLAFIIFFGATVTGIIVHKKKMFQYFLPGKTSLVMSFLLVPLEIMSFFAKPASMSVRLFANMMAGHTLLKVVSCFAWVLATKSGILTLGQFCPISGLWFLVTLEFAVVCIQSYVFTVLCILYISDSINLH